MAAKSDSFHKNIDFEILNQPHQRPLDHRERKAPKLQRRPSKPFYKSLSSLVHTSNCDGVTPTTNKLPLHTYAPVLSAKLCSHFSTSGACELV